MHHCVDLMLVEQFFQIRWIADVALKKFTPSDKIPVTVYKIIEGHRVQSSLRKGFTAMGPDISGTACYQYVHSNVFTLWSFIEFRIIESADYED
jgi:hypothetical protein